MVTMATYATYQDFIREKDERLRGSVHGIDVSESYIHPALYPFQRAITRRALHLGSAALFEDCGMGKTIQELEWARHVTYETGKPVLVFAPLAVGPQMVKEGRLIDYSVRLVRRQADVAGPVVVANYEMMQHFDPTEFGGLVLDESSILKNSFGKTRTEIISFASRIPYKLAATATPAPNDLPELLNHASYLGIMSVKEALAMFFTQDGNSTQNWRLKGHAIHEFWQWVGSWAIAARSPDDLGLPMRGYDLPELHIVNHDVDYAATTDQGKLFTTSIGINDMRHIRRGSLDARVAACADLANISDESWVIWCELNDESCALAEAIPGAVEVRGSDSLERKTAALESFSNGQTRVLVTKPSIAGHGLNWQHCARMAFVGASYSYEMQYQAIRRCWRYGQEREVMVHRFATDADMYVLDSVAEKERGQDSLYDNIPWQMHTNGSKPTTMLSNGQDVTYGNRYTLHLGDSVQTINSIETGSVGMSVFSPPFPGMYVYTDSPHDMGNVASIGEMIDQFEYLMAPGKMMRVLMPGRSVFIHITQGVAQLGRDGYVGLKDFRGDLIRMMEGNGWIYYGEVTIDKNPQIKALRTRDAGLQFKSLATDAARMHPALADMLLQFKKPGTNLTPIRAAKSEKYGNTTGWVTNDDWILWARPVWYADDYQPPGHEGVPGIRETDVLNVSAARSDQDERHLCPLQLSVIERCVRVWSNPGEMVYSPFAGVGSEGVVALQEGRQFVGGELKREYWATAKRNLEFAANQPKLFD